MLTRAPRSLRQLRLPVRETLQYRSISSSQQTFASVEAEEKDPVELDTITTLSNGVRVATEALPGHFSGIGVYVDAGSRYESDALRGVSHIIDRLAFKSTAGSSADKMLESIETLGGNIQCASSRESLMYQSATFNSAVPSTVALLAETIRDPLVTEEEVEQQLATADYEIGEIWSKPELILPELVHMAAFKDNTLGNPLLCPKERLTEIDRSVVDAYRRILYKPERMVVAFAGVDHSTAVKLTEQYFGDMKQGAGLSLPELTPELLAQSQDSSMSDDSSSISSTSSSSYASQDPTRLANKIPFIKNLSTSAAAQASVQSYLPDLSRSTPLELPSVYTGGFLSLPPLPAPANPSHPALTHIHLAFEALPITHPDIYALATLQTLLGGGGSFSAGGPGKGMYSRLYTNVLNQHAWVESCVAFNHSYTDSGLFGLASSCSPDHVIPMLEVMCREISALTGESVAPSSQGVPRGLVGRSRQLSQGEVDRAKNQLRSSLLMNLESRMVELEDLGRQVQVHGRKVGVKEMCRHIEEVTMEDLQRVARMVFRGEVKNKGKGSGAPTVVLQESEEVSLPGGLVGLGRRKPKASLGWGEIQERIENWKLGRR
ncbi:hypothetical protein P152DRAFT_410218 [Eremomyces bilateralis CBS 781.70]|uniref:Mitochondrial-processing peptidase subunit alpha n=1 Tax=Eremomyces bilateralis CBS 781.70 TaxID=1392243 RepID=A0A6G1GBF5_9PEZI|nr:uncharacterized protein P152DRAFT_410218 [Eremomyces bilateralis CBS 781.70]KAF1815428.1 hypothetical protein P152DRAFT_410218 [Eremomyces bilateralis CBS 781.70]